MASLKQAEVSLLKSSSWSLSSRGLGLFPSLISTRDLELRVETGDVFLASTAEPVILLRLCLKERLHI